MKCSTLALCSALAVATPAAAELTFSTNPATVFGGGSTVLYDFAGEPDTDFDDALMSGPVEIVPGLTLSAEYGPNFENVGERGIQIVNEALLGRLGDFGGQEMEVLEMTFDEPITAFGGDFGRIVEDTDGFYLGVPGDVTFIRPFFSGGDGSPTFLGFSSDTPFTTVRFEAELGLQAFTLDNIRVRDVPEPMALAWLAAGGLLLTRRR